MLERYSAMFLTRQNTLVKGWYSIDYDKEGNNQAIVAIDTQTHPYIKSVAQIAPFAVLVEDALGRWPRPR